MIKKLSAIIDRLLTLVDRKLVVRRGRVNWESDTCNCLVAYQWKIYRGGYVRVYNFNTLRWCQEHSTLDCFEAGEAAFKKNISINKKIVEIKQQVEAN